MSKAATPKSEKALPVGGGPRFRDRAVAATMITDEQVERAKIAYRDESSYPIVPANHDEALRAALTAALEPQAVPAITVETYRLRHIKRGTTYSRIGRAKLQTDVPLADMAEVVVYRCDETGELWARRAAEMDDGRFEVLE